MKIGSAQVLFSTRHRVEQQYARHERLAAGLITGGRAWTLEGSSAGVSAHSVHRRGLERVDFAGRLDRVLEENLTDRTAGIPKANPLIAGQAAKRKAAAPISLGGRTAVAPAVKRDSPRSDESTAKAVQKSATAARAVKENSPLADASAAKATAAQKTESTPPARPEVTAQDRTQIDLLTKAIEKVSGKKVRLEEPAAPQPGEAEKPAFESGKSAFGLRYQRSEYYSEEETTTFSAQAAVQTADGQQIEVDLDLTMSRKFVSEQHIDVRAQGVLQDPLVVNFDGPAASLTQTQYQFDIDSDGQEDQIHFAGPGTGFLALDRNGNDTVDDGTELFGAQTGNGFGELAAFDDDGNQFIDSGDSIFDRLRIWSKDDTGGDRLMALGQRGIGAIYLGHMATPFSIKDSFNQLQGMVRSSSFFLREDGSAGSVQQVDLVV